MGALFPTLEEVIRQCSDPTQAVFVAMFDRIGMHGWMTEVEYTRFRPDTPANREFHLTIMKWPYDMPDFQMFWIVVRMPMKDAEWAKSLLWKHGLRIPGGGKEPFVFAVIVGGESGGMKKFPLSGDNIFCIENHSEGAKHVAYTNDPKKIEAARRHEEDQIVKKFHDEHGAWLSDPVNYAAAEAYWAQYPDEFPPEKKPSRPEGGRQ
jgi:hypothetical protein